MAFSSQLRWASADQQNLARTGQSFFKSVDLASVNAAWTVPPSGFGTESDYLFFWIGLVQARRDNDGDFEQSSSLMQAAIGHNYPNHPNQWIMFSEFVYESSEHFIGGPMLPVNPGDRITGSINLLNSSAAGDIFTISTCSDGQGDPKSAPQCSNFTTSLVEPGMRVNTAMTSVEQGNFDADVSTLSCDHFPLAVNATNLPLFTFSDFSAADADGHELLSAISTYHSKDASKCPLAVVETRDATRPTRWQVVIELDAPDVGVDLAV